MDVAYDLLMFVIFILNYAGPLGCMPVMPKLVCPLSSYDWQIELQSNKGSYSLIKPDMKGVQVVANISDEHLYIAGPQIEATSPHIAVCPAILLPPFRYSSTS